MLLPVISIILTATSITADGILSFWTYRLPEALLLPAPYTSWTVFITATVLWCVSLACAIAAIASERSPISKGAFIFALSAPLCVLALAIAIFLLGLRHHPFVV